MPFDCPPAMRDDDVRKLIHNLRESISTFETNSTYALPAMDGFLRRHLVELRNAIEVLEDHIDKESLT